MKANNKSEYTKKISTQLWVLRGIDFLILVVPLLAYTIIGLCTEGVVYQKVTLVGTVSIALILTIFNIITKVHLRSPLWIVLIGLYTAVSDLMPLIITIACSTVIDEFVISPLIKHKRVEVISSKTIDKRGL